MEVMAFQAEETAYAHTRRGRVVLEERDSVLCWHNRKQSSVAGAQVLGSAVVGCGGSEAAEGCGVLDHAGACGFLRGSREIAEVW